MGLKKKKIHELRESAFIVRHGYYQWVRTEETIDNFQELSSLSSKKNHEFRESAFPVEDGYYWWVWMKEAIEGVLRVALTVEYNTCVTFTIGMDITGMNCLIAFWNSIALNGGLFKWNWKFKLWIYLIFGSFLLF